MSVSSPSRSRSSVTDLCVGVASCSLSNLPDVPVAELANSVVGEPELASPATTIEPEPSLESIAIKPTPPAAAVVVAPELLSSAPPETIHRDRAGRELGIESEEMIDGQQNGMQRRYDNLDDNNRIVDHNSNVDSYYYQLSSHEQSDTNEQQYQFNSRQGSGGNLSIPTSPNKLVTNSAPATPCNVTPIAFHQHTSHLNSMLNPNPANTLPPDIRKNISATCRVLPSSMVAGCGSVQNTNNSNQRLTSHSQYLDELIKKGDLALASKGYPDAVHLFSQCIELAKSDQNILKKNFKIYSQRAEAHFNLRQYNEAIDDSMAARELNPKWVPAYYRQGRAQFIIGEYAGSLAVYSVGLAQDSGNPNSRLFEALVDAALKWPDFKKGFEPKYNQLKSVGRHKEPFVVVSIIGQELLAKDHGEHAAIILESALKLGTEDKKLKGSVLSAISVAYCLIKDYEKATSYMQKELDIEKELDDVNGQCRVLSNLGYTYFKMFKFDKSLEAHRKQMSLAMKEYLYKHASQALNAMGHVHSARGDFTSALTSHTRCLELLKQLEDNDYNQFKEHLSIGHIHSMLADNKLAEEKYNEASQLLDKLEKDKLINQDEFQNGKVMVYFNLAYLALKKQTFSEAKQYYESVIEIARQMRNPRQALLFEMRASNGMGQMYRLFKKFDESKYWFEKQFHLADQINDVAGLSQALCNLGMIYQHFKDYDNAWESFKNNLSIVGKDPMLKAYAHSYMASMFFLMSKYNDATTHYEISMSAFKELNCCTTEKKTIDLNMAAVRERMGHSEVNLNNSLTRQKRVMMA